MLRRYWGEEHGSIRRKREGNPHLNTLDDLYEVFRHCWSKESAYPACQYDWVPKDPSYGQCAITAMLVYDMFGGSIHKIRVSGGGTHYFNKIDGYYIDLTREQFDLYNIPVSYEPNEEVERKFCGKNQDTKKRYDLLVSTIASYLKNSA